MWYFNFEDLVESEIWQNEKISLSENLYKVKFYTKGNISKQVEEKLLQKYRHVFNFSFSRQCYSNILFAKETTTRWLLSYDAS